MISIRLEDSEGAGSRPPRPVSTSPCASIPTATEVGAQELLPLRSARHGVLPDRREARARGAASGYLHGRVAVGDRLEIGAPRGTFLLDRSDAPVLLVSAGIGATPVLAMLTRAHGRTFRARDLVAARRGAAAIRSLPPRCGPFSLRCRTRGATCVTAVRRPTIAVRAARPRGPPHRVAAQRARPTREAEAYVCGPTEFMGEITAALAALGLEGSRIHTEPFGPAPSITPGIASAPARTATPSGRPAREWPDGRVRAQRPRHPVERRRVREPPRARRGVRRRRPLVVPHRRLPDVRDDDHRRRCRLRPRACRGSRERERAHLLCAASRRRGPRPLSRAASSPRDAFIRPGTSRR